MGNNYSAVITYNLTNAPSEFLRVETKNNNDYCAVYFDSSLYPQDTKRREFNNIGDAIRFIHRYDKHIRYILNSKGC